MTVPPGSRPSWLLAVQWHPEMAAAGDRAQQALFEAFAAEVQRPVAAAD